MGRLSTEDGVQCAESGRQEVRRRGMLQETGSVLKAAEQTFAVQQRFELHNNAKPCEP